MIKDASKISVPQPIRGNLGGTDPGPRNVLLDQQNPDLLTPPTTDHGTIPNLKFSFGMARNRLQGAGWAREVTIRELPAATTLAGVNMRLNPGGIRELHWHKEAEWGYVLDGQCRISGVDQDGRNFLDDVGVGDIWNFPAGVAHSIQGSEEGVEFLLVFDDGHFSENQTFLISDWFNCIPKEVLAKNFGVTEGDFDNLPSDVDRTRYIFPGKVPPPLASDKVAGAYGERSFSYHLSDQESAKFSGGSVKIVDSTIFPAASTVAAALVEIVPGGMRELHWHPYDEWQYYMEGKARMGVFASEHDARTFNYQAGDVGAVPFPFGHYVENLADTPLRYLEVFRAPRFVDFSLNQWMALTPPELVQAHLNLNNTVMSSLRKEKWPVVK